MIAKKKTSTQSCGQGLYELVVAVKSGCSRREEQIRADAKLSPGAYQCLTVIAEGEELTGRQVAERIGVSPSRGSRIVDALVQQGFLARRLDKEDRRITLISLSEEGARIRAEVAAVHGQCEETLARAFTDDELDALKRGLERLVSAL